MYLKSPLGTQLDNERADRALLAPLYSIEIAVTLSPTAHVKCGAIVVFRQNEVAHDLAPKLKGPKPGEDPRRVAAQQQELLDEINSKTETMYQDPIYFKQSDGRWLPWAIQRSLELYDRFGGSARLLLKCKKLHIRVARSPHEVARLRSSPEELFPVVRDIDELLDRGYTFDPWGKAIRRGTPGPRR